MKSEKKQNFIREAKIRGYKCTQSTIKIPDNDHPIQSPASVGANVEINLDYNFLGFSFRRNRYKNFQKSFENQAKKILENVAFNRDKIIIPAQNQDYFFIGISIPATANLALNKLKALHELSREFRLDT
tara:strand:- start:43 stop:429 length:387 start_codon:yes stop_codon:yes gene_type:complete